MLNPVSDLKVSLRLYKASVMRHITLTISRCYVFQMKMEMHARALRYTVGEVITFVDRLFGESNLDAGESCPAGSPTRFLAPHHHGHRFQHF